MSRRMVGRVVAAAVAGAVLSVGVGFEGTGRQRTAAILYDSEALYSEGDPPDSPDLLTPIVGVDRLNALLDGAEPPFCVSPLRLDERNDERHDERHDDGAAPAPAGGTAPGRGDPVCTEQLPEVDYAAVAPGSGALTGVAVLAGPCRAMEAAARLSEAYVAFVARFGPADDRLYDAGFEWRIADPAGSGTVSARGVGQPAAISPAEPLVTGVRYWWRVRGTTDPSSRMGWSEWFPYTLRC